MTLKEFLPLLKLEPVTDLVLLEGEPTPPDATLRQLAAAMQQLLRSTTRVPDALVVDPEQIDDLIENSRNYFDAAIPKHHAFHFGILLGLNVFVDIDNEFDLGKYGMAIGLSRGCQ